MALVAVQAITVFGGWVDFSLTSTAIGVALLTMRSQANSGQKNCYPGSFIYGRKTAKPTGSTRTMNDLHAIDVLLRDAMDAVGGWYTTRVAFASNQLTITEGRERVIPTED